MSLVVNYIIYFIEIDAGNIGKTLLTYQRTANFYLYLGSMLLLTMDRVLAVILNLRYPTLVTKRKILLSVSLLAVCAFSYFVVALKYEFKRHLLLKINVSASLIFTISVSVSYLLILREMLRSKRNLRKITPNGSTMIGNCNREHVKTRKAIIAPFFIVFTFIIFWVVPFQITYWSKKTDIYAPQLFLHPVGFISDAVIYIFLYPPAFKELKRFLEHFRFS